VVEVCGEHRTSVEARALQRSV